MNNSIDKKFPKEKFEFANENVTSDKKLETKPIGYFKDALIRFKKNRASLIAFWIIIFIVLFAVFMPVLTPKYKTTLLDTYYKQNAPRETWFKENLGILDGGRNLSYNEKLAVVEYAKGVGALFDGTDTVLSFAETEGSNLQPVIKLRSVKEVTKGSSKAYSYELRVDSYLSVGFIYKSIEQSEYQKILEWENETGIKVLYPLIEKNEYCFDSEDANYWFKTQGKCEALTLDSNNNLVTASFSKDLVLVDNYMRDSNGDYVYWKYTGGENFETAQYRVRILYYNYYQYLNGSTPNYLMGTDSQGYDLAYRLSTGIRLSLLLSVIVSFINFVIGAIYGAIEGYYGGACDLTLERIKDILGGIPFIIVATLFQMHWASKLGVIPSLIFAFVLTGWIGTSDRVRTQFYRFKNQEYVMAARTLGASDRRIIWKHVFPNTLGTIITSSVLVIPSVIFSESMLSFLGIVNLGGSTQTSLGTLLSDASKIWVNFPHLMIFPAIVISLLMICFNLFGNGLRDAFNPSLRGVEE